MPYTNELSIRHFSLSLGDGVQDEVSPISPTDKSAAAVSRFSALNDDTKIIISLIQYSK